MPNLSSVLTDTTNLIPAEPSAAAETRPPATEDSRVKSLLSNAYKRCPLPPSSNSADSLRQFSQGGLVPVFRTQTPPSNLISSANTVTNGGVVVAGGSGGSGSGSSSTTIINNPALPVNASVTTPALTAGQVYLTTLTLAKAFILLSVTVNAYARVELYGTSIAQMLDQSRAVGVAPANTIQGLLSDVVIQPPTTTWAYVNTTGANQDSPQSSNIYMTVTNLSGAVTPVTVSVLFVPEES